VFELALHGTMTPALETEPQAKSYPAAAPLNKRDAARFQPAQGRPDRRAAARLAAR
jgi:hypothetical protein